MLRGASFFVCLALLSCRRSVPPGPAPATSGGPIVAQPKAIPRPNLGRAWIPTVTTDGKLFATAGGKTAVLWRSSEKGDRIVDFEAHTISEEHPFRFYPLACAPKMLGIGPWCDGPTPAVVTDEHANVLERFSFGGKVDGEHALRESALALSRSEAMVTVASNHAQQFKVIEIWDLSPVRPRLFVNSPFESDVDVSMRSDGQRVLVHGSHEPAPFSDYGITVLDTHTGKVGRGTSGIRSTPHEPVVTQRASPSAMTSKTSEKLSPSRGMGGSPQASARRRSSCGTSPMGRCVGGCRPTPIRVRTFPRRLLSSGTGRWSSRRTTPR